MADMNNTAASVADKLGLRAVPQVREPVHSLDFGGADEPSLTIGELISTLEPLTSERGRFETGFLIQSIHPVRSAVGGPSRPITFCAADGATVSSVLDTLKRVRRDGWSSSAQVYIDSSTDNQRIIHSIRGVDAADANS